VKEGVAVLAGTPLFVDKATEKVKFVAPVSGIVTNVERGERRKLLSIRIQPDTVQAAKTFEIPTAGQRNAENMTALLLETGLFGYLRQRPYDVVPSPEVAPRDIFVSAFSTMPLAADFSFVVSGQEEDFKSGITALAHIAKVHVGVNPEQLNTKLLPIEAENVEVACFKGLNPAGNVGVQINKIAPVNKGEVVWTLAPEIVVVLGRLLRTGQVDFTRTIAVAGSEVTTPQYVKAKVGAKLSDVLANNIKPADHSVRIINGNPFVGEKATTEDFLAAHSTEITVIPEGDDVNEVLGWICPRLNQFSVNRSYFSWLLGKKEYNLDSRIKGGARHMIMSGEYESVFPMDIYPSYLVKAIITGDIDQQEALGIYEVAPEDFAPAEFVCSSKLELQRIVREGLEILRKENA
jgi:NADH:ubiquinone oxidoreductase, Na(+)-translocating, A subunit